MYFHLLPDSLVVRMLLCFSVYTNIPKILHAKGSSGSVACIHGIRFFSLTWVVLGHTYNYGIISMEETLNAGKLSFCVTTNTIKQPHCVSQSVARLTEESEKYRILYSIRNILSIMKSFLRSFLRPRLLPLLPCHPIDSIREE